MTAATDAPALHALTPAHLDGCLALSRGAHWNQSEADWRLMLSIGRGWGLTRADGALIATTLVLPYQGRFAWISMVLVHADERRRGYASQLLRVALEHLRANRLTPVLDATPAGREVYLREGFADTWGFKRYRLERAGDAGVPSQRVRALADADWPAIRALDAHAFGADRAQLLRSLATRLPGTALVCERDARVCGYVLGRDGRTARQVGPLVADDGQAAAELLDAALAGAGAPVYVDLVDRAPELVALVTARGFVMERPFTRMVHGAAGAPGAPHKVYLVAGPELG